MTSYRKYHNFEAELVYNESGNLGEDLNSLFSAQAEKCLIVCNPTGLVCSSAAFLSGSMPLKEQKRFVIIDIVSWGIGYDNVSTFISVGTDQFLIDAESVRRADFLEQELDDTTILKLRSWLQPGTVLWSKSLSRVLANSIYNSFTLPNGYVDSDNN